MTMKYTRHGKKYGRPKGSPNKPKPTVQQVDSATKAAFEAVGITQEQAIPRPTLAKDVMDKLMNLYMGMAAVHQPWHPDRGKNPHENKSEFHHCAKMALTAARHLAPFQSPTLAAVMVGAAAARTITVLGDYLPDRRGVEPEEQVEDGDEAGDGVGGGSLGGGVAGEVAEPQGAASS